MATALGSFVLLAPKALLLALAIFVAVVLVFRHVSLGSMLAVALFPALAWLLHDYGECATRPGPDGGCICTHHRQAPPEYPPASGRD